MHSAKNTIHFTLPKHSISKYRKKLFFLLCCEAVFFPVFDVLNRVHFAWAKTNLPQMCQPFCSWPATQMHPLVVLRDRIHRQRAGMIAKLQKVHTQCRGLSTSWAKMTGNGQLLYSALIPEPIFHTILPLLNPTLQSTSLTRSVLKHINKRRGATQEEARMLSGIRLIFARVFYLAME